MDDSYRPQPIPGIPSVTDEGTPPKRRWIGTVVGVLGAIAMLAALFAVLGPGAAWWVEHVDKVPLDGKDAVTGKDRQDVLDNARGRLAGIAAGLLAAAAIFYTAANAASARRTAEAAVRSSEASERTTQAAFHSAEASQETARAAVRTAAATERGLVTGRYTAAIDQLGSDKPAVQLGGVHALAGIADDAPDMRQTCIDVLCSYLRLPYDPDPGANGDPSARKAYRAFREVRHTVIRLIGNRLRLSSNNPHSWQGSDFDFTDVIFDGGDLHKSVFSGGTIDFKGAQFASGTVNFEEAEFIDGYVSFKGAQFTGGTLDFTEAKFAGSDISFEFAKFFDGILNFEYAEFSDGEVQFWDTEFSGGHMNFSYINLTGGILHFLGATLNGNTIDFRDSRFSDGSIFFEDTEFADGTVSFDNTTLTGDTIFFKNSELTGGTVDFTNAKCQRPPSFTRQDLGILLPTEWHNS
ncbi:pentapeptide repeat-containing protein [Actinocorallia populi]|uniref:pentapeptide repeat-containing protein n=1 Tax=Actinocorallia populi TaxID=2079200 RepID=UPI0013008908|nr:pentapeptide repeat-containing protein [Actinocorallia populi]